MTEGSSKTGGQLVSAADLRSLGIVDARGVKVVLDADLAAIFGVETRVLNQAVKRNQERFPTAWAFELTQGEFDDLRSQDVISSVGWGGRRTPPWVFSEHGAFGRRLQGMIERLMDAMVDQESQRTLRDEAQGVLKESIEHIRAKLGRANFENEEIAARAAKLLAEAEATRATAVKTRAEADEIALRTLAKKLTMLLEAEQAMARGEAEGFLKVLRKLGKA